jgi:hypothetical protein
LAGAEGRQNGGWRMEDGGWKMEDGEIKIKEQNAE